MHPWGLSSDGSSTLAHFFLIMFLESKSSPASSLSCGFFSPKPFLISLSPALINLLSTSPGIFSQNAMKSFLHEAKTLTGAVPCLVSRRVHRLLDLCWQSSELNPSPLVLKPALIPCSLCSCEQRVAVQLKWVGGEWEGKATPRVWHG